MATSGGPRLQGIGRSSNNLVLCLDARDANSYAGEPTTNLSANSDYSGATLDSINSSSNGGWGSTFDRWVSLIEGPAGKKVRAFHLKLTGTTGSAHAEGAPYELSGIDSQYGSLTSGNSYRASAWAKVIRADGSSTAQTSSNLLYLTGTASLGSSNMTVGTEWTKISASFSISSTGNYRLRHYFYNVSVGDILVIAEPQIELKGYSTPYVYSSRSATDGWVDLSNRANDGTLTNMTGTGTQHYRYGQVITLPQSTPSFGGYLDFDGTNDYVVVTNGMNSLVGTNATTFGAWIYIDTVTSSWDGVIANKVNVAEGIALLVSNTQKIFFQYDSTSGNYAISGGSNIPTAEWTYIVATYDTVAGYKTYMNGELNDSEADAGKSIASSGDMSINIGAQRNSSGNPAAYFPGKIAKAEIYNKALSAAEIKSNYNQFKGRFGL